MFVGGCLDGSYSDRGGRSFGAEGGERYLVCQEGGGEGRYIGLCDGFCQFGESSISLIASLRKGYQFWVNI